MKAKRVYILRYDILHGFCRTMSLPDGSILSPLNQQQLEIIFSFSPHLSVEHSDALLLNDVRYGFIICILTFLSIVFLFLFAIPQNLLTSGF
jgi:hypothetical protein